MKKLYALLIVFLSFGIGLSQQAPPQGINYQAMVYVPYGNQQPGVNSAGQLPANTKQVLVKFTIEEGNNGPVIYEETHIDTTDQYGLLNTVIGTGTPTSISPGLFNQIDWSLGNPYLRVSITLIQYNSTVNSYQKLWSVPYALYSGYSNSSQYADTSNYANQAGNGISGVTDNGNGTLTFTYLDGSSYTTPVLTGLMGVPGPQGPQGIQGPAGQNGTNGQSAYDIWLSQGNIGTQQDFLNSLQGSTGPQGPTGVTGSTGLSGINGQSAYDIWLAQGNIGTEQDFLNSLQGNNGFNTLMKTTTESAGINCQNGGTKIEIGMDQNNNGILDLNEINISQTTYVCNGEFNPTNNSIGIGDYYDGGIVAYILKPGDNGYDQNVLHGYIVALNAISFGTFDCLGVSTGAINQSLGSGQSNTNLIIANCSSSTNAANYCNNLVYGGKSDWFLPSSLELKKILTEGPTNTFYQTSYISSSEASSTSIFMVANYNGGMVASSNNKVDSNWIMPVRFF